MGRGKRAKRRNKKNKRKENKRENIAQVPVRRYDHLTKQVTPVELESMVNPYDPEIVKIHTKDPDEVYDESRMWHGFICEPDDDEYWKNKCEEESIANMFSELDVDPIFGVDIRKYGYKNGVRYDMKTEWLIRKAIENDEFVNTNDMDENDDFEGNREEVLKLLEQDIAAHESEMEFKEVLHDYKRSLRRPSDNTSEIEQLKKLDQDKLRKMGLVYDPELDDYVEIPDDELESDSYFAMVKDLETIKNRIITTLSKKKEDEPVEDVVDSEVVKEEVINNKEPTEGDENMAIYYSKDDGKLKKVDMEDINHIQQYVREHPEQVHRGEPINMDDFEPNDEEYEDVEEWDMYDEVRTSGRYINVKEYDNIEELQKYMAEEDDEDLEVDKIKNFEEYEKDNPEFSIETFKKTCPDYEKYLDDEDDEDDDEDDSYYTINRRDYFKEPTEEELDEFMEILMKDPENDEEEDEDEDDYWPATHRDPRKPDRSKLFGPKQEEREPEDKDEEHTEVDEVHNEIVDEPKEEPIAEEVQTEVVVDEVHGDMVDFYGVPIPKDLDDLDIPKYLTDHYGAAFSKTIMNEAWNDCFHHNNSSDDNQQKPESNEEDSNTTTDIIESKSVAELMKERFERYDFTNTIIGEDGTTTIIFDTDEEIKEKEEKELNQKIDEDVSNQETYSSEELESSLNEIYDVLNEDREAYVYGEVSTLYNGTSVFGNNDNLAIKFITSTLCPNGDLIKTLFHESDDWYGYKTFSETDPYYYYTEKQLKKHNKYYEYYSRISSMKSKYRDPVEYIKVMRYIIEFVYYIGKTECKKYKKKNNLEKYFMEASFETPEEFVSLWANGIIHINGVRMPKYSKRGKEIAMDILIEYILDIDKDPMDILQYINGKPDYSDEPVTAEDFAKLELEVSGLMSLYQDTLPDPDDKKGINKYNKDREIQSLSNKELRDMPKSFMKCMGKEAYSEMIQGFKKARYEKYHRELIRNYGIQDGISYEDWEDQNYKRANDIDPVAAMDEIASRSQKSKMKNKLTAEQREAIEDGFRLRPLTEEIFLDDDQFDEFCAVWDEFEYEYIKNVNYLGRMITQEQKDYYEITEQFRRNGIDLRSMYPSNYEISMKNDAKKRKREYNYLDKEAKRLSKRLKKAGKAYGDYENTLLKHELSQINERQSTILKEDKAALKKNKKQRTYLTKEHIKAKKKKLKEKKKEKNRKMLLSSDELENEKKKKKVKKIKKQKKKENKKYIKDAKKSKYRVEGLLSYLDNNIKELEDKIYD